MAEVAKFLEAFGMRKKEDADPLFFLSRAIGDGELEFLVIQNGRLVVGEQDLYLLTNVLSELETHPTQAVFEMKRRGTNLKVEIVVATSTANPGVPKWVPLIFIDW